MRIIAGEFRSRRLKVPRGHDVRPTSDRIRESIFNILSGRLEFEGRSVADLYAGSGALGLEALSRGAAGVSFVERSPRVIRVARENAASLGVLQRCEFLTENVRDFLRRTPPASFDVVFADPPYDSADLERLPAAATRVIKPSGFLILEHDQRHDFSEARSFLTRRPYGGTVVTIFQTSGSE